MEKVKQNEKNDLMFGMSAKEYNQAVEDARLYINIQLGSVERISYATKLPMDFVESLRKEMGIYLPTW